MTNPFAQNVPVEQPQQPDSPAQGNPFAAPAPVAPQAYAQPAPAGNPYAPQPAPAGGNPFAQNTGVSPHTGRPAGVDPTQHVAGAYAQQTAPAPVAYAQPVQQQPVPPQLNPGALTGVGAPVIGEGTGAKLVDMYGRLLLVFPLRLENVPRNPQHITPEDRQKGKLTQDRMTATVVALDDGQGGMQPVAFGGQIGPPPIPHTDYAPLPYVRKAMWIPQTRLISQLQPHLSTDPRAPGMTVGRLVKAGPGTTDAWFLQTPTGADLTLAGQYLQGVQIGHFPHPLA